MRVDTHQHLWPPAFVEALRARDAPPRIDGDVLVLEGGMTYRVDLAAHDPQRRAAEGPELIAIAASAGLGLDEELSELWLEAALELGPPFAVWAPPTRDPERLESALARGALGLEIPAATLAAPGALDALEPLLETLGERPLLVHPGHATVAGRPEWWLAVVPYVAELHAAWWAWVDGGRERFPDLPVCFAALAGLAPLHGERHRARGGASTGTVDPLTFVETSSYGTQAVDAVIRVLGVDVICHGSDRPYAEPARLALDPAALHAIESVNPTRLLALDPQEVPA